MNKLFIATLLLLTACNNLPDPPKGDLCIMDIPSMGAICVSIKRVAKHGEIDLKDASHIVQIKDMDNWVAFSPDTWAQIQTYIGELKNLAENHCQ